MSSSKRLNLPFLEQSQAQKEVVVNEALSSLDFLVQPVVLAMQTAPPSTAAESDAYIINGVGTGSWSGKNNNVAVRVNGAWKYMAPFMGMNFFSVADNASYTYKNGSWQYFDNSNELSNSVKALSNRVTILEESGVSGGSGTQIKLFKGAMVSLSAAITGITWPLIIPWSSVGYDTHGFWSSTNPTRLTIPAGVSKVRIGGNAYFNTNGSSLGVHVAAWKNGLTLYLGAPLHAYRQYSTGFSDEAYNIPTSMPIPVAEGDYFEFRINCSTNGLNTLLEEKSWFAIEVVE